MSICPIPPARKKRTFAKPTPTKLVSPPLKYEYCAGSTFTMLPPTTGVTTVTVCCPSPGPAGPVGPQGPEGPSGSSVGDGGLKYVGTWATSTQYYYEDGTPKTTSIVKYKDVMYVCLASHTASADTEPGIGFQWETNWEVFGEVRRLHWMGDWAADYQYYKSDVVRNQASGGLYVAKIDNLSDVDTEPGFGGNWEAQWDLMTAGSNGALDPADQSFFDELKDNVFDWMKNATIGDWITALAVGSGIAWAGDKIIDAVFGDGEGDGNADSRFNGSPGYAGTLAQPTLPVVVASLMDFGGFPINMIDISLLPATPVNFTVDGNINIRTVLSQLSLAYQFDIISSGSIIKFVPKYQATVRTLTRNDMGHVTDNGVIGGVSYAAKRIQGIDLPRSVTLKYYSSAIDHNVFTQTSTLETFTEGQDSNIEVPFTLDDAQAKAITESVLVNAHIEQQQYTFVTDYYNIDLEPSDVINIPLDSGGETQVRIIEVSETDDGLLQFTASRSDYNSFSYVASGQPAVIPPTQTTNEVVSVGYSDTLFLEVPMYTEDLLFGPRLVGVLHGFNRPGYPGSTLYRSDDGGNTYSAIMNATSSSTKPVFGLVAIAPIAPPDYHIWDTTTTITVQLAQGTLISKSDLAVLNGENWAMVGTEMIGFANATLIGTDTYSLSRLLRGRQGTEQSCSTHITNELFVLLDSNLVPIPVSIADLGKTIKFKTVTYGSSIDKATAVDVQPYGLNLRPWAPAQLKAVREANNDWTISWVERPRSNNSMRDYVEISHDADYAGFGYAILSGTTLKTSGTTTNPYFTYTAAQQITDFGSVQGSIKVSVTQMSTKVGGGIPAVQTF